MSTGRMTIMGTRHVISAGHYLAAHAGFQILEAGGNAIDAGVAAGIAIGEYTFATILTPKGNRSRR